MTNYGGMTPEQLQALFPHQLLTGDAGRFGNYATRGDQSLQQYLAGGGQAMGGPVTNSPYSTYAPGWTHQAVQPGSPEARQAAMGTPYGADRHQISPQGIMSRFTQGPQQPNTQFPTNPGATNPTGSVTPQPGVSGNPNLSGWDSSAVNTSYGAPQNTASGQPQKTASGGVPSVTTPATSLPQPTITPNATTAPASTGTNWNSLFNPSGGYDGTVIGYDATTPQPGSPFIPSTPQGGITSPSVPSMPGTTPSSTGNTTGNFPTGAETLGQSMYPWLTPYQGNFTAPMSQQENQGLSGIQNFVQGGQNLGGAQSYINSLLSGQFLSPSTNPYLQQVTNAASGIHDYQDQLEKQRIASSMAAGGNALSGARGAAEEQYQNESNNQFQNMINNMYNQNYQNERGLMQQGVPLQMGLSNQVLGGYNNEMSAGGLPRQLSQSDLNSQYGDYLRQIQGLQSAYQQPFQNAMGELSHGYTAGSSYPQYGTSGAAGTAALLSSLLGGGSSSGGGLLGALSSLFGGGGGGTSSSSPSSTDPNGTGGGGQFDSSGNFIPFGSDTSNTDPYGFLNSDNLDLSGLGDMSGGSATDPSNQYAGLDPQTIAELQQLFGNG